MDQLNSADNTAAQTDVNQTTPQASSTVEAGTTNTAPSPEGANLSQESKSDESRIPYNRFKQVVDEKNDYAKRLEELEKRLNTQAPTQQAQVTALDKAVQKFRSRGLDEESARLLAETAAEIANETAESKISPLMRKTAEQEINAWIEDFSKTHTDYKDLEPKMYEVFSRLPSEYQNMLASDKTGLEMLYGYVKSRNMSQDLEAARQQGVNQAYENRSAKAAVASSSAGSSTSSVQLTRESVAKMSAEEYSANRDKILDLMKQGKL